MLDDFLTFLLFGAAYSYFFMQIFPKLEAISRLTGIKVLQTFDSQTEQQINQVASTIIEFTKLYNEIKYLIIYFAVTLLVIWIITQSVAWYNTNKIIDSKREHGFKKRVQAFLLYLSKFSAITVISFLLLSLLIYLGFKLLFLITFTAGNLKPEFTPYIVPVIILIVMYFTLIAYTQILSTNMRSANLQSANVQSANIQNTITSALKQSFKFNSFAIFILSLLFISIFAVLITLLARSFGSSYGASILYVTPLILLVFPLIGISRLWLLYEGKNG